MVVICEGGELRVFDLNLNLPAFKILSFSSINFSHSDEFELVMEDENLLLPFEEPQEATLDTTMPAVLLSPEEKKKMKNRQKGKKRRAKKNERLIINAMAVADGKKTEFEVAEEDFRRKVEGMVARERGKMRKEAEEEIERRLAIWKADVEAGRVDIHRGISAERREKRSRLQEEHHRRKRAEHQAIRRKRNNGWAAVGRHAVFGDGPASFDSLVNAGIMEPLPGPSSTDSLFTPEIMEPPTGLASDDLLLSPGNIEPPRFEDISSEEDEDWEEL